MSETEVVEEEFNEAPLKKARLDEETSPPPGVAPEKKTKPCGKFFSTAGCQFGDTCHYQHFVPGGVALSTILSSHGGFSSPPPAKSSPSWQQHEKAPKPGFKTRLCTQFYSSEGCRFQERCIFAHGEAELRKGGDLEAPDGGSVGGGGYGGRHHSNGGLGVLDDGDLPPGVTVSGNRFTIPLAMVGPVIGKAGAHVKHILRTTGAKVSVKEFEADPQRKHVYVDGGLDETRQAMKMVKQFILNRNVTAQANRTSGGPSSLGPHNYKTRMCEKYLLNTCTFGDRCHFAHGVGDLR